MKLFIWCLFLSQSLSPFHDLSLYRSLFCFFVGFLKFEWNLYSKRWPIENLALLSQKTKLWLQSVWLQFSAVFVPLLKLSCLRSLFTKTKRGRHGVTEKKQKRRQEESWVQRGCERIKTENKSLNETHTQLYITTKPLCVLTSGMNIQVKVQICFKWKYYMHSSSKHSITCSDFSVYLTSDV